VSNQKLLEEVSNIISLEILSEIMQEKLNIVPNIGMESYTQTPYMNREILFNIIVNNSFSREHLEIISLFFQHNLYNEKTFHFKKQFYKYLRVHKSQIKFISFHKPKLEGYIQHLESKGIISFKKERYSTFQMGTEFIDVIDKVKEKFRNPYLSNKQIAKRFIFYLSFVLSNGREIVDSRTDGKQIPYHNYVGEKIIESDLIASMKIAEKKLLEHIEDVIKQQVEDYYSDQAKFMKDVDKILKIDSIEHKRVHSIEASNKIKELDKINLKYEIKCRINKKLNSIQRKESNLKKKVWGTGLEPA
jgi:hypothetical protein